MKTIHLSDKEYKLLIKVLKEASETRGDMGCNDAYDDEEKMFTKDEKLSMAKHLSGKFYKKVDEDEMYLANFDYVDFLIKKIKTNLIDSNKIIYKWKYKDSERPLDACCYDCGILYGTFPDMVVEHNLWEKINPTHHKGCGILCPTCMCIRFDSIDLDNKDLINNEFGVQAKICVNKKENKNGRKYK
jgi:hypothetical protein